MRDLWIHENDLIVATHGRSFWILDDITPLRQIGSELTNASATLFQPAQAYRVRRDTNTDTPLPPDEPAGENPPDGAVLDYFLAKPADGPVTLEILDSRGLVVRKYSSADQPERTPQQLEKELIPLNWLRPYKKLFRPKPVCTAGFGTCIIQPRFRRGTGIRFQPCLTIPPGLRSALWLFQDSIRCGLTLMAKVTPCS